MLLEKQEVWKLNKLSKFLKIKKMTNYCRSYDLVYQYCNVSEVGYFLVLPSWCIPWKFCFYATNDLCLRRESLWCSYLIMRKNNSELIYFSNRDMYNLYLSQNIFHGLFFIFHGFLFSLSLSIFLSSLDI